MDTLYGLTAAQIERLRRLLSLVETGEVSLPREGRRFSQLVQGTITGLLTNSVDATSDLTGTPKVGTLNIYTFSSTGTVDTGNDETVYNFAPQAATTDRWTRCGFDVTCGKWVIDTQYCS